MNDVSRSSHTAQDINNETQLGHSAEKDARGCCTACDGWGRTTYELCWDCRGAGCAHPEPLCVIPPAEGRL